MNISIVVPVFNEQESLAEFYLQTKKALTAFEDYEIIFVDDGSTDESWSIIDSFCQRSEYKGVRAIKFTRNFGHQIAVFAGMKVARFECIAIIDADLQDPPELLPAMCSLISKDIDIVYGKRISRNGETWFKKISALVFYRIFKILTTFEIPVDTGDFRIITRRVRDQVSIMNEHTPFLRGLFAFTGYKSIPYEYARNVRYGGESKYNLRAMLRLASNAILTFSDIPFKLFIRFGLFNLFIAVIFSIWAIVSSIINKSSPGWLSSFTLILFLGSLNLCFTGLVGKYVIQTLQASRNRPLYFIDKMIN